MKPKVTQKRLKELLKYNHKTGIFVRRVGVRGGAKGAIAGTASNGYIQIGIDWVRYAAHRLAWLYVYGYFPEFGLDHRDRVRNHNWIDNLREKSQQCNLRNTGTPKNNTSGVKGVIWDKSRNKWQARIHLNGHGRLIGRYEDFTEAVCARLAAEQCLDWSNCDSSSPAFQYVQKMLKEK
jgi:hypothetical protein